MTPAEIVACVDRFRFYGDRARQQMSLAHGDAAKELAAKAFHEAAKLLDFCAPKTCGTCADWRMSYQDGSGGLGDCVSETSRCADACETNGRNMLFPADHGCPQWRRKEER